MLRNIFCRRIHKISRSTTTIWSNGKFNTNVKLNGIDNLKKFRYLTNESIENNSFNDFTTNLLHFKKSCEMEAQDNPLYISGNFKFDSDLLPYKNQILLCWKNMFDTASHAKGITRLPTYKTGYTMIGDTKFGQLNFVKEMSMIPALLIDNMLFAYFDICKHKIDIQSLLIEAIDGRINIPSNASVDYIMTAIKAKKMCIILCVDGINNVHQSANIDILKDLYTISRSFSSCLFLTDKSVVLPDNSLILKDIAINPY